MHAPRHTQRARTERMRDRVTIDDDSDVRYWTAHFGVSDFALWEALLTAGDDPRRVAEFLRARACSTPVTARPRWNERQADSEVLG